MTAWNTFYTGSEQDVNAAIQQINSNCGFPNGSTDTWGVAQQAYEQNFWFVIMPPPQGYMDDVGSWTQLQMINGVTNVVEEEGQPSWWPPSPFPPSV